jgi:large subunit ribosomal protein L4
MTTSTSTSPAGTAAPITVDVRSPDGPSGRSVELPAEVFAAQVSIPTIHQVVVAQLAAARQGTHSTKTRGEVRGGGRKPYRQKGTGRARQGSTRAPQFAGGGVVHGPQPRDYAQRTPKKMKAAALRGALSDRARHGRVHVVSALTTGDVPSTKTALALLTAVSRRRHVLVVAERTDTVSWKSLRNAPQVHLLAPGQLNTYDVLVSDDVVFTEAALQAFLAGSGGRGKDTVRSAKASAVFRGDLPGSAGTQSEPAEGSSSAPGEPGTPGEDLTPHNLDSDVPSVATASSAPGDAADEAVAASEPATVDENESEAGA